MSIIKILVASHKTYEFPTEKIYQPIQVGKARNDVDLGILADDTGENISQKNDSFCELTALYWAWKNDYFYDADYVGLVHYRRYFKGELAQLKQERIASEKEICNTLKVYDGIVAKKRHYVIETVYSHYRNAHYITDLDKAKKIVTDKYPEYIVAFDAIMNGRTLSLYNMFVLRRHDFNEYCEWLFDILFELEQQIDISDYDAYQRRVFGFISERLFNVWVLHRKLQLKPLKVVNIDGEPFFRKCYQFLIRKFLQNNLQ